MLRKWAIAVVLLAFPAGVRAQGLLSSIRQEVREKPADNNRDSSSTSASPCLDEEGESLLGALTLEAFLLPIRLPALLCGESDERLPHNFTVYPYSEDVRRMLKRSPAPDDGSKGWQTRLSFDGGPAFHDVTAAGVRFRFDTNFGLGFSTEWRYYRERMRNGGIDELTIGSTNFTYRFAQCSWMCFHAGLGFRNLIDRQRTDWGFNALYGFDWLPMRPYIVSSFVEAGTLGHAGVFRANGTIGAIYRRFEVYAGYDYLQIGSTPLHGPIAGVRLWF